MHRREGRRKMEAEIRGMQTQTEGCQQPPDAGELGDSSPRASGRVEDSAMPRVRTSGLQTAGDKFLLF